MCVAVQPAFLLACLIDNRPNGRMFVCSETPVDFIEYDNGLGGTSEFAEPDAFIDERLGDLFAQG